MPTITRQTAATLQREINEAIEQIATRHGLKMEKSRATFSDTSFKVNVAMAAVNEAGDNARFVSEYATYAKAFDMRPEWLGQTAQMGPDRWQLLGLDTRRRTFDTPCRNEQTGEVRLFKHAEVARAFRFATLMTATKGA